MLSKVKALDRDSIVVRDNTPSRVTIRNPSPSKEHNASITHLNQTNKESIGIYANDRCQWNDQ